MSIDSSKVLMEGYVKNWVLNSLVAGEFQEIDVMSENDLEVKSSKRLFKKVEIIEWPKSVEDFDPAKGIKKNIFLVAKWRIEKRATITPLEEMEASPENFMLIKMIVGKELDVFKDEIIKFVFKQEIILLKKDQINFVHFFSEEILIDNSGENFKNQVEKVTVEFIKELPKDGLMDNFLVRIISGSKKSELRDSKICCVILNMPQENLSEKDFPIIKLTISKDHKLINPYA